MEYALLKEILMILLACTQEKRECSSSKCIGRASLPPFYQLFHSNNFVLLCFLRLASKIHFQLLSWQWMETLLVGIAFVPIVVGDGTNVLPQERSSRKFFS